MDGWWAEGEPSDYTKESKEVNSANPYDCEKCVIVNGVWVSFGVSICLLFNLVSTITTVFAPAALVNHTGLSLQRPRCSRDVASDGPQQGIVTVGHSS